MCIGTGTNGASAMAKVGKIIDAEQQLCIAHGLQLTVIDVLQANKINRKKALMNPQMTTKIM